MTEQLAINTMLVAFTTGLPRQSTQLKTVAAEVEEKNHAQKGTVRASIHYFKRADPNNPKKELDGLRPLKEFQNDYKRDIETLARYPYAAGLRLLPALLVGDAIKIKDKYDKMKAEVWQNWIDEVYPDYAQTAPQRMGSLFNQSDFPDAVDCLHRFTCEVEIIPLGTAQQIERITLLSPDHAKILAQSVDEKVKKSVDEAHVKLWEDVMKPIAHMVDVLTKDKGKIYESMLENIHEIVNLVPSFGAIVKDAKLQDMATSARVAFAGITVEDLRKSDESKKKALVAAQSLLHTFTPFQRKFAQ